MSHFPSTLSDITEKRFRLNPDDLYKCVHCGFCLSACPTYLETGLETESPRGRIALMKEAHQGKVDLNHTVVSHWDSCIQCRACETACPSNVPYSRLMEETRHQVNMHYRRPLLRRLANAAGYRLLLNSPKSLRSLGTALKLYSRTGLQKVIRTSRILRLFPGVMAAEASLPHFSKSSFKSEGQIFPAYNEKRARVALLAGCVMPTVHADAMHSVVRVLQHNGIEVCVPEGQGCCGALNIHAGETKVAQDMMSKNIKAFSSADFDAVVTASAGCGAALKEYGELMKGQLELQDDAASVAEKVRDIHEFLEQLPMKKPKGRLDRRVVYQDACHLLHAQRITKAPRKILDSISGLERHELEEREICCGSGGAYSLHEPEMSQRLGRRKAKNVINSGAEIVTTGNPGCAMQMQTHLAKLGSNIEVRYVSELLDEAYALEHEK